MPTLTRGLMAVSAGLCLLTACQSELSQPRDDVTEGDASIQVNQLGFTPDAAKAAVVPANGADRFELIDIRSGQSVYSGTLSEGRTWEHSGERVRQADFSSFTRPGRYQVRVAGLAESPEFEVREDVYQALNDAAIKAYYFNRVSTELTPEYAGDYARPAGHPDTEVEVHRSAASEARPEGTVISSPKGWYDAGDYNKYIVNSGISTYTLLAAFEHFPEYYTGRDLTIPESGDAVPDLLDETMWNLEWMLTMQDPNDGGVYHKLTTKNFSGKIMPHEGDEQRYVVAKGTAAALNYAAVMATASRVYAEYEEAFPGFSSKALESAEAAWQWARENPDVTYRNPEDIQTGEYGDDQLGDEFAWAAAELYITTGNDDYYRAMNAPELANSTPSWSDSKGLAWMSLAHHREQLTSVADRDLIDARVTGLADELHDEWQESPQGVPMRAEDFVWGSNGVAMNSAMMLLQGYRLSGEEDYRDAAQALLDYVLGRNPTEFSYVTDYGSKTPQYIHHRPSEADEIEAPVPGFLAGGPHSGQQDADDCPVDYPSDKPAKSYLDHWCSYSTNEITINWNAPLVYVSGALQVMSERD